MSKKKEVEFPMEEKLKRLREITEKMQAGQITFEENVNLFREGMELVKESRAYLENSEFLIKKLIEGQNGDSETEFEA